MSLIFFIIYYLLPLLTFSYTLPPHDLASWLSLLKIQIPEDLIKNQTGGFVEDLELSNISLGGINSIGPKHVGNMSGVNVSLYGVGVDIKVKAKLMNGNNNYDFRDKNVDIYENNQNKDVHSNEYITPYSTKNNYLIPNSKEISGSIRNLALTVPLFLISDPKTGLIAKVNSSGLSLDMSKLSIHLNISEKYRTFIEVALKTTLIVIKEKIIEKKLVELIENQTEKVFKMINDIIINGVQPIPLKVVTPKSELLDLRKSTLLSAIGFLFSNLVGSDGPANISYLVNVVSNNSGVIKMQEFYNKSLHFGFNITGKEGERIGKINLGIDELNVGGLNTWKKFSLMEPEENIVLKSDTFLKDLTINLTFSMNLSLYPSSHLVENETILFEKAHLRTNLKDNSLQALFQLPVNGLHAKELTNFECLNDSCLIPLADKTGTGVKLLTLNETFTYIILSVFKEHGGLEEDLDDAIDKLAKLFISEYDDKIGLLINALLNKTIIDMANEQISTFIKGKTCTRIPDLSIPEINFTFTSIAFLATTALFFVLIYQPYILGKAKKSDKKNISGKLLSDEQLNSERVSRVSRPSKISQENQNIPRYSNLSSGNGRESYLEEPTYCVEVSNKFFREFFRTDHEGASLFLNPRVHIFYRIFIPFAILFTVTLFLSSNSGTGASVYLVFHIARRIQIPSLFDFGLINSVRDMWKAGVYPLSILVAVFSGIWPYLKLILMLISFVMPTSILSYNYRGRILRILDATGKWSILDSYVMTMMLVAFQFHIDFPVAPPSIAEEGAIIDVFVHAAYGFLTLIVATLISMILSHVISHIHRSLDEHPDQDKGELAEKSTPLINFAKNKIMGKWPFRITITILLFGTFGLVIAGSIFPSFQFHFHGLAQLALGLFNIEPMRIYSVLSLGYSVPSASEKPNDPTIRFMQTIFYLTVFVLPMASLIDLIFLWLFPLARKSQRILLVIAEVLCAWSCLDVFVISLIAAILEIGQFAAFIVGDKCDFINPVIDKYLKPVLDGHNTCFEVRAYLLNGCWILFAAAILFFIVSFIIKKVCRNALNERLPQHVKDYMRRKKMIDNDEDNNNNNEKNEDNDDDNDNSKEFLNNEVNDEKDERKVNSIGNINSIRSSVNNKDNFEDNKNDVNNFNDNYNV